MEQRLEQLILAQLQEIATISRSNQLKLERLDTMFNSELEKRKKEDDHLNKELAEVSLRLEKLEGFRVKLVMAATTAAFMVTIIWDVASKVILPLLT